GSELRPLECELDGLQVLKAQLPLVHHPLEALDPLLIFTRRLDHFVRHRDDAPAVWRSGTHQSIALPPRPAERAHADVYGHQSAHAASLLLVSAPSSALLRAAAVMRLSLSSLVTSSSYVPLPTMSVMRIGLSFFFG